MHMRPLDGRLWGACIMVFWRRALTGLFCLGCVLLPGWITVGVAQPAEDPKATPSTLVIFDGSGSMWGKLEGEKPTKFVQARDAIRVALGKVAPQSTHVGLMSYGHRRQGDCTDVQVIAQAEAAAAPAFTDRIVNPLEKINPKGKGPLTAALREAAKVLGKAPGPRSIVLIHDDPDNCQQDACAALAELQQSAPGVVVHVVGLGLRPDDVSRYQCLTRATGGRHIDAQDGGQVAAGVDGVLALALQGARGADQIATLAKVAVAEPVKPLVIAADKPAAITLALTGPPALRLRALLAKDVALAGHRVRWSVWPDTAAAGVAPIATADGIDTIVPLALGTYRVRAEAGLMAVERTVTAGAQGETLAEAVFEAAEIRLKGVLAGDATLLVSHRAATSDPKAPARRIGIWPHGQTALLVPPGAVTLHLEQAELRADRQIEVAAGQAREVEMAQAGGRVLLDLMPPVGPVVTPASGPAGAPGGAAPVTIFAISEDDPDAPRGRKELARSAATTAEFVVAPGSYIVSAMRGALETRERVTVAAGDAVRRSLPLVAARLIIAARLERNADGAAVGSAADTFRLSRLDSPDMPPLLLAGPAAIVDLPPGRYRVTARRNAAAINAQQDIELKAGDYKTVTLEYQAGGLRLEAVVKGEAGPLGIAWLIADETGRLVWSSAEAAPTALLGVGRYTVRMALRGARYEVAVDIRHGEITSVRLGQP